MGAEKTFENSTKAFLKGEGCWVLKTYSNGIQRKGVPDLLICCNGHFVAMEIKAVGGEFVNELQPWNIRKINESGGIAGVLIPKEGVERFRNYISRHYPAYSDTPIYDFDGFKKLITDLKK